MQDVNTGEGVLDKFKYALSLVGKRRLDGLEQRRRLELLHAAHPAIAQVSEQQV